VDECAEDAKREDHAEEGAEGADQGEEKAEEDEAEWGEPEQEEGETYEEWDGKNTAEEDGEEKGEKNEIEFVQETQEEQEGNQAPALPPPVIEESSQAGQEGAGLARDCEAQLNWDDVWAASATENLEAAHDSKADQKAAWDSKADQETARDSKAVQDAGDRKRITAVGEAADLLAMDAEFSRHLQQAEFDKHPGAVSSHGQRSENSEKEARIAQLKRLLDDLKSKQVARLGTANVDIFL
jgi:hypothetical protein